MNATACPLGCCIVVYILFWHSRRRYPFLMLALIRYPSLLLFRLTYPFLLLSCYTGIHSCQRGHGPRITGTSISRLWRLGHRWRGLRRKGRATTTRTSSLKESAQLTGAPKQKTHATPTPAPEDAEQKEQKVHELGCIPEGSRTCPTPKRPTRTSLILG